MTISEKRGDLKIQLAMKSYTRAARKFAEFLGHSPDLASEDQLRNYLLHLVDAKQWKPSTINVAQQALKRFFRITCPRDWAVLKSRSRSGRTETPRR